MRPSQEHENCLSWVNEIVNNQREVVISSIKVVFITDGEPSMRLGIGIHTLKGLASNNAFVFPIGLGME